MAFGASAQSLPDGPGKELVEVICTSCHSTERIVSQRMNKTDWQSKVLEMLQEEPDVTQVERDQIVEYLSRSFPQSSKVKVNEAAAKELAAALEISNQQAEAIVQYREGKGRFRTLDDLKKVPGLDAAKIEAKKDRLEF
jgi:competence protein ComEA